MKKMRICAGLVVLLMGASGALAAVRSVPGQYASIQGAIDEAQDGDIVIVDRGTYREIIDFKGKNITVRSTDPNNPQTVAATIITFTKASPRGKTPDGSVVTFARGEGPGAVLAGFTITGGYGTILPPTDSQTTFWGAGILCLASSPTIMCNVLTGNTGPLGVQTGSPVTQGYGGGIACVLSNAVVVRNVIRGNSAYAGAGVFVYAGAPRIANNLIYENSGSAGGGAVLLYGGDLVNNTIVRNNAGSGGGLYLVSDPSIGYYYVANNIITNALSGGGIYCETFFDEDAIAFNDVWGNIGGSDFLWAREKNSDGNISQDPMILSPITGDFHLHMDSPCINAGDPGSAGMAGETDAYGDPRINHGRIDIGAVEFAGDLRPVANAGPDQSMNVIPAVVTLDASGSYDPDHAASLTYRWSQVGGSLVTLDVNGPIARFSPATYGAFIFELIVSDGAFDSVPDRIRIVVDNGSLPIAEAGLPVYTAGENVTLNGAGSRAPDNSGPLHYHWRQLSGPAVQIADAGVASPTVSGFVRDSTLQVCVFELTVDDGQYTGLPDSVEIRVVPPSPGVTLSNESGHFDANLPTVIYFGGGDCITGSGGWSSADWSQRANVLSFSYQPDMPGVSGGTYERCGDTIVLYLSRLAPNYKMPIQTIGFSTGGQPAMDAALRLNRTYRDARYAVNRITFTDGRCRNYSLSILEFLANPVDGEQCWIDSYDSAPQFYPGILNVHISNGVHGTPPQYYRISLTNANMNDFNGGLVAGAYWSVIGPGKNLQLALTPNREVYEFRGYDAVSAGYEFMQFYDEPNFPARLPEPVMLLAPIDVGDPCGVVLTCKPSRNAVGYELLLGRDPYRVMDFNVVSDTPAPPDKVIRTLPFEETWWTVRARDAYGSTIYADPVPIRALNLSLPVTNLSTGKRYAGIQDAADNARSGDEICLQPGTYRENIQIAGKGLTIRSTNPGDPAIAAATIIDGSGNRDVLTCSGSAGSSLTLAGLTIRNGKNGVYCSGTYLTMTGCIVIGNQSAGVKLWNQSRLTASNCIIAGNRGAGVEMWAEKVGRTPPYNYATMTNCTVVENGSNGVWGGKPTLTDSIVWNNGGDEVIGDSVVITYSDIQGGNTGQGNIDADPLFAQAGSWSGGAWMQGDYHLKSKGARWSVQTGSWVRDDLTSPCIDAGDPASLRGQEPESIPGVASVNTRIDMGAYGGTAQASLAP
jgi:hypothetical protein